jgi:hypothetical protein
MDEKKEMFQRLKDLEDLLVQKRRKWFLGIWLGYSAIAFLVLKEIDDMGNVLELFRNNPKSFIGLLIESALLGFFCWFVNAAVWSNCCNSIQSTKRAYEQLEKEYNNN